MIKIHLSRLMGERKEKIVDVMRSTGLARNTIAGLYNEDVARIDLSTLEMLCKHYNCNVSELIEFIPNETQ
jgi:putative transcriptional regulator